MGQYARLMLLLEVQLVVTYNVTQTAVVAAPILACKLLLSRKACSRGKVVGDT